MLVCSVQSWKPEKTVEARIQKTRSQSLVWHTLCSAKNIILRLKFPLLNPEVQCRNGPFAHKKQCEIQCYKKQGPTYLGANQIVKTEQTLSAGLPLF